MKHAAAFILSLFLALAISEPARAHRPYYSQVEKIRLPDGQIGEVRLLHGDGVFFKDPVRPIIVDEKRRFIARGPRFYSLVVSCDPEHLCIVVDLWTASTLSLDAASFRGGVEQPTVRPGERTEDWALEGDEEGWGFSVRKATSSEFWSATMAQAFELIGFLFLLAGLAAGGAAAFLVPVPVGSRSVVCLWIARAIILMVRLAVYCFLAGLSLLLAFFAGLSMHLWLLSLLLGSCGLWLVVWCAKRSKRLAKSRASIHAAEP